MKTHWGLIGACVLFSTAVFAIAVLEGFNSVDRSSAYETARVTPASGGEL